jgi:hypothetical protein
MVILTIIVDRLIAPKYLLSLSENSNEIKDIHFAIADRLLLFDDSCY